MGFLNKLFKILSIECGESSATAKIQFNPSHPIYQGHFPGNPITPGAMLLQTTTELIEEITQQHVTLSKVGNVKFRKPIGPAETVDFVINKMVYNDGTIDVGLLLQAGDAHRAKMSLQYTILS